MKKGQKMSKEQKEKIRLAHAKRKQEKEGFKETKITTTKTDTPAKVDIPVKTKEEPKIEPRENVEDGLLTLDRNIKMNGITYSKGTKFKKNDVNKDVQRFLI